MVNKQALFIIAIVSVFFAILALMYFQVIILEIQLLLVIAIIFIIVAVMIVIWWFLSRRKGRPLRLGKDLEMDQSMQTAKNFWSTRGIVLKFPSTHYCYGEERFDEGGANRYHGFAGVAYSRTKQTGTGNEAVIEPINPHETKELGRCVTVINATEKRVVDWYIKPYQKQYEDLWKRLGLVSSSRRPSIVTKMREVSPITGMEKETITAPTLSEEVQPKEEVV